MSLVKLPLLNNLRADLPAVSLVNLQTHLYVSLVSHVANDVRYSTDDANSHGKP
jgi:hypothetical protein